jgi:hypothetical protein
MMRDEEKLARCKQRAAAEPYPACLASILQDMAAEGIPLDPALQSAMMGKAIFDGEAAVRRFIDEITLASVARPASRG